jgi:hypothetical protein
MFHLTRSKANASNVMINYCTLLSEAFMHSYHGNTLHSRYNKLYVMIIAFHQSSRISSISLVSPTRMVVVAASLVGVVLCRSKTHTQVTGEWKNIGKKKVL